MFAGSLRGRLLWWLLLPLAAFVSISGVLSYRFAQTTADLVQDNALLSSMRIIGEDIDWDNGSVSIQIPPAALELFESPEQDSVFYRVEAGGRRLLAGSLDLPLPPHAGDRPVLYSTRLAGGREVRAVAYVRQLYDSGRTEEVVVAVAKTEGSRDAMVWHLLRRQLFGEVLTLLLAMIFVYLGLTFELLPLMKVKDDVANRNPSQLEPIRVARLHVELRPIVDAINQCIARMGQQAALVDNALRYTQSGGRVTVQTRCSHDRAIVRVIDNGPGIKPEARACVFERFYRASSHAEGTGLGLPIVRQIAHRQGGSVTLESNEDGVGLVATVEMRLWECVA